MADLVLEQIAASEEPLSPKYWVRRIGVQLGAQIGDAALARLAERGILERTPGQLLLPLRPGGARAIRPRPAGLRTRCASG